MGDSRQAIENKKLAQQDREDISRLRDFEPFNRYFKRRLTEKVKAQEEIVLHDRSLTPDALDRERKILHALEDVAGMLDADDAASVRIIGKTSPSDL